VKNQPLDNSYQMAAERHSPWAACLHRDTLAHLATMFAIYAAVKS